ncbi:MAG: hypothetical protein ACK5AZ_07670 [Bryobacteraceae bacterium]
MSTAVETPVRKVTNRRARSGSGWRQRLLVISFSDCLFLALLLWPFAIGVFGWLGLLSDGDTGWHIRTGEYILEHREVPREDFFSFTKPGEPWFAWEWLADVVLALLYRAGGLKGVVLFSGVMTALFGTLLFRSMLWRGATPLVSLLLILVGMGAASIHFLARPHLFTLVLLPVALWVVERDRQHPTRAVWLLVPLTVVWTNLHGGFLALIACLGLLAAGEALRYLADPESRRETGPAVLRYGLLTAACAAASVVNPYGVELHRHVGAYLRSDWIRDAVQEFQSPSFRSENAAQFELLLFAGLLTAAPLLMRKRYAEVLWILFWAHSALTSVRHVTIYVVVVLPLIAVEATRWWDRWTEGSKASSVAGVFRSLGQEMAPACRRTSVWVVAAVVALCLMDRPIRWPQDFPEQKFPIHFIGRHAEQLAGSRVLTSDEWSDYLLFRFYPQQRVFVDGRSDFYGPEIGKQYVRAVHGAPDWEEILDRHRVEVVMSSPEWALTSLLRRNPGWRLVEAGEEAVLFERVTPPQTLDRKSVPAANEIP